eukprot:10871642-Ditylum_brightwellii.AAC.1
MQSIVKTFLYYSRSIDGPALPALNNISTQQSALTQATITDTEWIMDFFHTYPNARLHFFARDMQLCIDSDAAYLVMPGAKSHIVGYFFLSAYPKPLNNNASHNVLILVKCCALKNAVCSVAEAECGRRPITTVKLLPPPTKLLPWRRESTHRYSLKVV